MSRYKSYIIYFVVGAIACFVINNIFGFFRWPGAVDALEAVPNNSALILESTPSQVVDAQKIAGYKTFANTKLGKQFKSDQRFIDSLLQPLSRDYRLLSAVQVTGADTFALLHIVEPAKKQYLFNKQFIANIKASTHGETYYGSFVIHDFTFKNGAKLSLSVYRNLLLVSRKSVLVEYAAEQLNDIKGSLYRNPTFCRAQKGINLASGIRLYVQSANLGIFSHIFAPIGKSDLAWLKTFKSATALGVSFEPDGIQMQGTCLSDSRDLSPIMLAAYRFKPSAPRAIFHILPDNISILHYFGVSNLNHLAPHQSIIANTIGSYLADEAVCGIIEPAKPDFSQETFALFTLTDSLAAEKALDEYGQKNGAGAPIQYLNFMIKECPVVDFLKPVFGDNLPIPEGKLYYATIEKYLVFTPNLDHLRLWIDQYKFNQTLGNSISFQQFRNRLPEKVNYFCYLNTRSSFQLMSNYVRSTLYPSLQKEFIALGRLSPVGIAAVNNGLGMTLTIRIGLGNTVTVPSDTSKLSPPTLIADAATIAWRAELQDPALTAPFAIKNGQTGKTEFIVQDTKYRLYGIANDGRITFVRPLESAILSSVFQTDFRGNGELVSILNTREHIYFLKADGKDAASPLNIPNTADVGLFAVDYGPGMRLYVGCKNGSIYGFEKDGSPLEGWSPQPDTKGLRFPLQHFKTSDNKDFICGLSRGGTIHAFDRVGKKRFAPVTIGGTYLSTFGVDAGQKRLAACDKDGIIHVVNTEGKTFDLKPKVGKNENVRFAFADVVGDERNDYILLSGTELAVYTYNAKKFELAFKATLSQAQSDVFTCGDADGKFTVATLNREKKQLSLFDSAGNLRNGFPLAGHTRCILTDLFGDGGEILITANEKVVYAYKL